MGTNQADDYADGLAEGPSREAIESAVLDFDDANNGYNARAEFSSNGEYVIGVNSETLMSNREFDKLWEFEDWALRQELAADDIAKLEAEAVEFLREVAMA